MRRMTRWGRVVAVGVVRRCPVVPDADVSRAPPVADRVLWLGEVRIQQVEDPVALSIADTGDVRGEAGVDDEQPLASGLGVDADDRMVHRGQLGDDLAVPLVASPAASQPQVPAPFTVAVVHRGQPIDQLAHRRGQGLVGQLAVDPAGVPTTLGQHDGPQDRPQGGRSMEVTSVCQTSEKLKSGSALSMS